MLNAQSQKNGSNADSPGQNFEALIESAEAYGKVSIEVIRLKLIQSVTRVATTVVARLAVLAVVFLFLLILSIGISLYLGELIGKPHHGFLVTAGFYLLLGIVFAVFLRKWLHNIASRSIIEDVLQNK